MSTVLRVYGDHFKVHEVLPSCPIKPDSVSIKGQPRPNDPTQVSALTGFNLCVSTTDWEPFQAQIDDSRDFITEHEDWLASLRRRPDVDALILDFGVLQGERASTLNLFVSPSFSALLAALGITMEISLYPPNGSG